MQRGFEVIDPISNESFNYRAHLILFQGDIPAITKLMGAKGHNSKRPCRYCLISPQMATNGSYYCCHFMPHHSTNRNVYSKVDYDMYNRESKYVREDQGWRENALRVEFGNQIASVNEGISHFSPFLQLNSVVVPFSFSLDIMHCIIENVANNLWSYVTGDFHSLNTTPLTDRDLNDIQNKVNVSSTIVKIIHILHNSFSITRSIYQQILLGTFMILQEEVQE